MKKMHKKSIDKKAKKKIIIDYSKCERCKETLRNCRCYDGISDYHDPQNYCGGY